MRAFLRSALSGIASALALSTAAIAAPEMPVHHAFAPSPDVVLVDARCGHGWRYVPQGYARHGKWRDAHCSRN
jgi:hypothetical protein